MSSISTEANILGTRLAAPIFVAPMGSLQRVHPRGEAAAAAGAAAAGVGFILSTEASNSIEEVARSAGDARWFQLYFISSDRGLIADLVYRAERAGFGAICVTADAPVGAFMRRSRKHEATGHAPNVSEDRGPASYMPSHGVVNGVAVTRFPLRVSDPALTWKDVDWLRSITQLPLLLKGVMTAEDARIAMECGLQGIVVSNHGGRHLDHALATVETLPEIVDAVGRRGTIILDSGVRRATDIAIALALGANAVAMGRPSAWALAFGGSLGVASFMSNLIVNFARTMAELGITSIDEFRPAHVGRR